MPMSKAPSLPQDAGEPPFHEVIDPVGRPLRLPRDPTGEDGLERPQAADLREQMAATGYAVVRDVVPVDLLAAANAAFDREIKDDDRPFYRLSGSPAAHTFTEAGYMREGLRDLQSLDRRRSPQFAARAMDVVTYAGLTDLVEVLLGERGKIVQTMYFEGNAATQPHQDTYYLDADPPGTMIGAWIAAEDIAAGAGRFFVCPGSERVEMPLNAGDFNIVDHYAQYLEAITGAMTDLPLEVHAPAMRAGDVLFWSSRTIHGSLETTEPERSRRSFTAHFIPDSAPFLQWQTRTVRLKLRTVNGTRIHHPKDLNRVPAKLRYQIESRFPDLSTRAKTLLAKQIIEAMTLGDGTPAAVEAPAERAAWLKVAAVAFAVTSLFVAVRLVVAAHGDVSRFVVAGSTFADRSQTPSDLHVFADSGGYDGQFMWRLAADPTYLQTGRHLGMTIDSPLRLQRIGYPALAWALSWGNLAVLPWALILVNLVAVGALAGIGAVFARDADRSPWLGLVVAAVPGFAMTLSRDLTELVAVALFVGGVLAARRGRWWLVAGLWSYAVLTLEQLVVPIAAFALCRVWQIARRRARPGRPDAAWIAPAVAYGGWQLVIRHTDGVLPSRSGADANFGAPFMGLVGGIGHWFSQLGAGHKALGTNALTLFEFGVLVCLVAAALMSRVPNRETFEKWMVVALALLGLTLTRSVWDVPADLRTLTDLSALAWVVVIGWGRSRWLAPLVSIQTVALAGAMAIRLVSV